MPFFIHEILFIVSCVKFFNFCLDSNFALCYTSFTSSSSKPIAKLKKRVRQSKPPIVKLAIVKSTSSKLKQRSHRITSRLEFSNTQANLIEIEEAEEEVSMHRKDMVFTDESKKQGSSVSFKGGNSFNDLS